VSSIHDRPTRQSVKGDLYIPPKAKLACYRNSLSYAGAELWNKLKSDVREAPSVSSFKARYMKNHL